VTGVLILGFAALALCLAAVAELLRGRLGASDGGRSRFDAGDGAIARTGPAAGTPLGSAIARLDLGPRLARAGLAERISLPALLAAKAGGRLAGSLWAIVVAPAAPGRLAWIVAVGLPVAGFLGPDAWLEWRARKRLSSLRGSLPDALDLLAVGTAAGRSPIAGLAELGAGDGALARELAVLSAESACGAPQREALEGLRRRVPVREVAAMCGLIERSRRYGSPLADQLRDQATALRGVQRRRIEEEAAKAAPKIQLAVALLLVPSVLLMIAAGLLANIDRFMAGF
jgi:tight adherence protein C